MKHIAPMTNAAAAVMTGLVIGACPSVGDSPAGTASGAAAPNAMAAPTAERAAAAPVPVPGPPLETRERNGKDYQPALAGQTRSPGIRAA